MRSTFVVFGAVVAGALIAASGANASTGPIPLNCDRACLEGVMNQYLEALAARDPKRLPLSADFKYTENDQPMELGDGFWKTVESVGNYKHIFADPGIRPGGFHGHHARSGNAPTDERSPAHSTGTHQRNRKPFTSGRAGAARLTLPPLDKPGYKPEDMWFKSIPPAQRLSRPEMISIADAYFSGLEKNDGKGVNGTGTYPFTNDCDRIENGSHTTNVPRPPNEPKMRSTASPWTACRNSSWDITLWCRRFMTGVIRSWMPNAA